MGRLVNGIWTQTDVRDGDKNTKGEFLRKPMSFRGQITNDGPYKPEAGRYHLYVSHACPWAHRTLIFRQLKGLQNFIDISFVSPVMLDEGWTFLKDFDDVPSDPINNAKYLRDIYLKTDPQFTGRVTVPILWDKELGSIVNNESSEIIRIFNSSFNTLTGNTEDYYPEDLRPSIEEWNEVIYHNINNGVYRCGFAKKQAAYEEAFNGLYQALEKVEEQLRQTRFLTGDHLTEADLRLFPTVVRFDPVYHTHFKCNGKLIREYKGISRLINDILALPSIAESINMKHIKHHYYYSHTSINPSQIVPNPTV